MTNGFHHFALPGPPVIEINIFSTFFWILEVRIFFNGRILVKEYFVQVLGYAGKFSLLNFA